MFREKSRQDPIKTGPNPQHRTMKKKKKFKIKSLALALLIKREKTW